MERRPKDAWPGDDWTWSGQGALHSMFLCVLLDGAMADQALSAAGGIQRRCGLGGALRPRSTLHVTLWTFAVRDRRPPSAEMIRMVTARAAQVLARPFLVTLNQAQHWGARGPLVLVGDEGVIGLHMLHRQIATAFGRPPRGDFHPHVSVAWDARPMEPQAIAPLTWTVRDFALVHSFEGEGRYETLARFPLLG